MFICDCFMNILFSPLLKESDLAELDSFIATDGLCETYTVEQSVHVRCPKYNLLLPVK